MPVPPKAKRFNVLAKDPVLGNERLLAVNLTAAQAKVYRETMIWDIRVMEVLHDK